MARHIVLAMTALAAVAAPASAQPGSGDWVEVTRSDTQAIFLDRASVTRTGAMVRVSSRVEFDEPMEDGTKTMFTRFQYDCAARTADLLSIRFLDESGRVVTESTVLTADRRVEPIGVNSPNQHIAALVCR